MAPATAANRKKNYTSIIRTRSQRPQKPATPRKAPPDVKTQGSRVPFKDRTSEDNRAQQSSEDEILLTPNKPGPVPELVVLSLKRQRDQPNTPSKDQLSELNDENAHPSFHFHNVPTAPALQSPPSKRHKPIIATHAPSPAHLKHGRSCSSDTSDQKPLPMDGPAPGASGNTSPKRARFEIGSPIVFRRSPSPAHRPSTPEGLGHLHQTFQRMSPLTPLPPNYTFRMNLSDQEEDEDEDEILLSPRNIRREMEESGRTATNLSFSAPVEKPAERTLPMMNIEEAAREDSSSSGASGGSLSRIEEAAKEASLDLTSLPPPTELKQEMLVAQSSEVLGKATGKVFPPLPLGSKLPIMTPLKSKVPFTPSRHRLAIAQMSPLTPADFLLKKTAQVTWLASPRKDKQPLAVDDAKMLSPVKTRIPAPIIKPSPAPEPAKVLAKPRSPLKERLRRGTSRQGAGAREKNKLLGKNIAEPLGNKEITRKIALARQLSPKKPTVNAGPFQEDKKPRDANHALSRLDKALARLSLPKPSRPPSALGHISGDSSGMLPPAAPLQRFSSSPALGAGNGAVVDPASPRAALGPLGLPMRRPGVSQALLGGLTAVPGSPVKNVKAIQEPAGPSEAQPDPNNNPFLVEQAAADADIQLDCPQQEGSASESKGPCLDDIVLRINGVHPQVTGGIVRRQLPEPVLSPVRSSSVRVFEASRALGETIAQNVQVKTGLRVVSERVVRPVRAARTASLTVEHQKTQPRANAKMAGSLNVLKGCVIYVDVTLENGEDAGGLFVEMLKGLGARILGKPSRQCTHIVFKDGSDKTILQWRTFPEPRPKVVGIRWVVECAEKRQLVDETRFLVDLSMSSALHANEKRRRSIIVRPLTSESHPEALSGAGNDTEFLEGRPDEDTQL